MASDFLLSHHQDWQGKLWGNCRQCVEEAGWIKLKEGEVFDQVFHRLTKKMWRHRMDATANKQRIVRATGYKQIFADFFNRFPGETKSSVRKRIQVFLTSAAEQVAADLMASSEKRRKEAEEITQEYERTVERQAEDPTYVPPMSGFHLSEEKARGICMESSEKCARTSHGR